MDGASVEWVEKGEIEKEWSGALVGHVSEVGTCDKIPTKVLTSSVCSEVLTSFGMFERLGPWAPAKRESLVGLLERVLSPIFSTSESENESDQNATWGTEGSHWGKCYSYLQLKIG